MNIIDDGKRLLNNIGDERNFGEKDRDRQSERVRTLLRFLINNRTTSATLDIPVAKKEKKSSSSLYKRI